MNKMMFALSLAKKSGKLIYGFDPVKQAVTDKTAKLVCVTSDTSEKTLKRVNQFCQGIIEVQVISLTQFEVAQITNKLTGVFAVIDENIAILCKKAISSEKESN